MKGSTGTSTTLHHLWIGTPLYNRATMKTIASTYRFSKSSIVQARLEILEFHKKHGTAATIDAYGISKRTIFRWKKALKEDGQLESLIPQSRTPHNYRTMNTHPKITVLAISSFPGDEVRVIGAHYGPDGLLVIENDQPTYTFQDSTGILTQGMFRTDQLLPQIHVGATVRLFNEQAVSLDFSNPILLVPVQAK